MGGKGKRFTGKIIKGTWTITREGGNRGRRWKGVGGKGRKKKKKVLDTQKS